MSNSHDQALVRQLRLGKACRLLPYGLSERVSATLGVRLSFLLLQKPKIIANLQAGLGLDAPAAEAAFKTLCASTGVAAQLVWRLPHLHNSWLQRHVHCADAQALTQLRETGGVVLSHHSFHHNLLASSLKQWGLTTLAVANPPTSFSSDDYLFRFTRFLNQATETNLNGGRFLYVDGGREFLQSLQEGLRTRKVLLLFCDFNEEKPFNPTVPFLHGSLTPPSGVLRQALKSQCPVYFAGFQWSPGAGFALSLKLLSAEAIPTSDNATSIMLERYLAALAAHLRVYPHAWQNWAAFG